MKREPIYSAFSISYLAGLISFLILFYLEIKITLLTNFVVIISIILLLTRSLYWFLGQEKKIDLNKTDREKSVLFKLSFCIFAYISPTYYIIQQPDLVISHSVSTVTLTIITILAMISIIIERRFFLTTCRKLVIMFSFFFQV